MRKRVFTSTQTSSSGRKRRRIASFAIVLPLAAALAGTQLQRGRPDTTTPAKAVHKSQRKGPSFETGCGDLPFQRIATKHWIDDHCGIEGITSPTDLGNKQQNRQKNNFCLHSRPITVKPDDLVSLQIKVDALSGFRYGSGRSVPTDRSQLKEILSIGGKSIGEGTLVMLAGYMIDAHYSDVAKGEGVNCKQSRNEQNDIHFSISDHLLVLSSDRNAKHAQLCQLVTGEISPHYRPRAWEVEHLDKLERTPVRVTGQLFFDASHVPCQPGKLINPARKSVWEIHPTYAIDICNDIKRCRIAVDTDWMPLDKWVDEEQTSEIGESKE